MSTLPALLGAPKNWRVLPVEGDHMEPTLRRGDYVGCVPPDNWSGPGLYVIDNLGKPVVYRFDSINVRDGLRLHRDNERYHQACGVFEEVSYEWFKGVVLGKVMGVLKPV